MRKLICCTASLFLLFYCLAGCKQQVTLRTHIHTDIAAEGIYSFTQGIIVTTTADGFILVDADGTRIGKETYNIIYAFDEEGHALAQTLDGAFVYLDKAGSVIGAGEPLSDTSDTERYDAREKNGQTSETGDYLFGIKDKHTENYLTEPIFEWISGTGDELNYAILAKGEHRRVMISPRGEVKVYLSDDCEHAYLLQERIVCRYKDQTYRLANTQGVLLNETAFTSISPFFSDVAVVTKGTQMGLIDKDGTLLMEPLIEIDKPMDNNTPHIWEDRIACIQNGKLTIFKVNLK